MACDRFETEGLLYLSGELEADAAQSYAGHLAACEDCRVEHEEARAMSALTDKGRLFEEETTPVMDDIILKLCAKPVRPATVSIGFGAVVRRFALPVLFLAVGFGGGAYLSVIAMQNTGSGPSVAVKAPAVHSEQIAAAPASAPAVGAPVKDSLKPDSATLVRHPLGNLNNEGVVPVKLGGE